MSSTSLVSLSLLTTKTMILDAKTYNINIGNENTEELIHFLETYKGNKIALFSDEYVYSLYSEHLKSALANFQIYPYIYPQGESSKSLANYEKSLSFLSENNFTRSDLVIGFGGGVTGDLAGFVASTYLRGIPYIAVPTSLLAMVDSSVGGKTGLNLSNLKNQIGSFYFPEYVHIDTKYLQTLSEREVKSGLGEIIKYSLLKDKELFNLIKKETLDFEEIIYRSLKVKLFFVDGDEYDKGKRQFLNLGHSLGHCIEALSDLKISHGQAVAIGIYLMTILSQRLGYCQDNLLDDLSLIYDTHGLEKTYYLDKIKVSDIINHDKKIANGKINLIFPVGLGQSIDKKYELDDFLKLLDLI